MTKFEALKREAREACVRRGHKMRRFKTEPSTRNGVSVKENASVICEACGMAVYVDTRPLPNSIDICGEAVATDCPSPLHTT